MKFLIIQRKSGITLVEIIVYLAVFGAIILTVLTFFIGVSQYNQYAVRRNDAQKAVVFLDQHFASSFESDIIVDQINSTFSVSPSVLELDTATGSIRYTISNNRLQVERDGVQSFLVDQDFLVTNFVVDEIFNQSTELVGIKISLILQDANESRIVSKLDTSYVL